MLVTIIVFGIAISFLSAAFACFSRIENTEKAERSFAIMLEEFIIPFIVGVGFLIVGGFLLKENVDNKVDDIIENLPIPRDVYSKEEVNTEFYPDDYTVKCKVITIDNKSDTTYFLERKKHKKK